jgi:hypothetical protein
MTDQPTDQANDQMVDADQPHDAGDQPATDQLTTPAMVSLDDAALTLGITVNAVRQRIKRGTLIGIKTDAGWLVDMVATNQESGTDRPTRRPTNHTSSATDHRPTIDLAPMVNHIATLEDQLQRLTEASTMWQIRARQAEEQLKALTAGESEPASSQGSPTIDAQTFRSLQASDEARTGIWAWVKQLWGSEGASEAQRPPGKP